MNADRRRWGELLALQLAVLVVAAHLWWGLPRFVEQLRIATIVDPRPLLFVLSTAAIATGVLYAGLGGRRAPIYALGILLMVVFEGSYVWWHVAGHEGALPWVERPPLRHPETGVVETVLKHLRAKPLELLSKTAELVLAIVLGILLYGEYRDDDG